MICVWQSIYDRETDSNAKQIMEQLFRFNGL